MLQTAPSAVYRAPYPPSFLNRCSWQIRFLTAAYTHTQTDTHARKHANHYTYAHYHLQCLPTPFRRYAREHARMHTHQSTCTCMLPQTRRPSFLPPTRQHILHSRNNPNILVARVQIRTFGCWFSKCASHIVRCGICRNKSHVLQVAPSVVHHAPYPPSYMKSECMTQGCVPGGVTCLPSEQVHFGGLREGLPNPR